MILFLGINLVLALGCVLWGLNLAALPLVLLLLICAGMGSYCECQLCDLDVDNMLDLLGGSLFILFAPLLAVLGLALLQLGALLVAAVWLPFSATFPVFW